MEDPGYIPQNRDFYWRKLDEEERDYFTKKAAHMLSVVYPLILEQAALKVESLRAMATIYDCSSAIRNLKDKTDE